MAGMGAMAEQAAAAAVVVLPPRRWTQYLGVVGTGVLVVVPTILFFVFTAPFYRGGLIALVVFVAVLFVVVMTSMVACAAADPGYLPRQVYDPNAWNPLRASVSVLGVDVECKFCATCNMLRRPRSTHCSTCNACVDCPFLSNCVGRRNYRMFLVFVNATTLLGLLMLGMFIGHFLAVTVDTGFASTVGSTVSFALTVAYLVPVLMVAYLTYFHWSLLSKSVSTNEEINNRYVKHGNPYKQPLHRELAYICCAGRVPRYSRKYEEHQASSGGAV